MDKMVITKTGILNAGGYGLDTEIKGIWIKHRTCQDGLIK